MRRSFAGVLEKISNDSHFWTTLGEIMVMGIVANVQKQRQHDGSRLKANTPGTREKKLEKGRLPLSLVDEQHRLVAREKYAIDVTRAAGTYSGVEVHARAADIQAGVQRKGYVGWARPPMVYVRAKIKEHFAEWVKRGLGKKVP